MTTKPIPDDETIRDALRRSMVHVGYVSVIKDLLQREGDHWRSTCCDSGCDPCIQTLARVVDELSAHAGDPQDSAD